MFSGAVIGSALLRGCIFLDRNGESETKHTLRIINDSLTGSTAGPSLRVKPNSQKNHTFELSSRRVVYSQTELPGEPLLPRRRTIPDKGLGLVSYDPQGRRPGEWDVAAQPRDVAGGNYVTSNAVIAAGPQPLGRNLSNSTTVTVNLIAPQTYFSPRRHSFDLRVGKIIRYGRTRTQVGIDVFNLMNNDEVTTYNQAFDPTKTTWLTPTGITPARYVRFNAQFDF